MIGPQAVPGKSAAGATVNDNRSSHESCSHTWGQTFVRVAQAYVARVLRVMGDSRVCQQVNFLLGGVERDDELMRQFIAQSTQSHWCPD